MGPQQMVEECKRNLPKRFDWERAERQPLSGG